MKRILIIANDTQRWGPARLPQPLAEAGTEVAALCSEQNPLCHSSFVSRHYEIGKLKSWRSFGKVFGKVMTDWKPDLVIPCDEPVVVMLHHFLKNEHIAGRYLNAQQIQILQKSIGHRHMLDAMVLKHHTRLLAESLGVPVPQSQLVTSADDAANAADAFGFPVFLKKSFSWAGQGSIQCQNASEVRSVFESMRSKPSTLKKTARQLLARDWYPSDSVIEVQKGVEGDSVMFSAVAYHGKMLAGLFGSRTSRLGDTGPSTVVDIGDNAQCRWAAQKMIGAMGASGFLAFDFMRCANTGDLFLLECNPRPNQICHLGNKVGIDLCHALHAALNGQPGQGNIQLREASVPLFPQEWLRDEQAALAQSEDLDVPYNDVKLFSFMLDQGIRRGNSVNELLRYLGKNGRQLPDYTFA